MIIILLFLINADSINLLAIIIGAIAVVVVFVLIVIIIVILRRRRYQKIKTNSSGRSCMGGDVFIFLLYVNILMSLLYVQYYFLLTMVQFSVNSYFKSYYFFY